MIDLYLNYERTDMHNVQKDFWISFTTQAEPVPTSHCGFYWFKCDLFE